MAKKNKFPGFAVFILIVGLIWFVNDMFGLNIHVPWIPLIVILIALSVILKNRRE